jgi:spore germination protein YaaH
MKKTSVKRKGDSMKKAFNRFLLIFITAFLMASVLLSFNVGLNVSIRQKINQVLKPNEIVYAEPGVYLLGEETLYTDENGGALIEARQSAGAGFINMEWFKKAGFTYHYDVDRGLFNIVGNGHFLSIEDSGSLWLDGVKQSGQVSFAQYGETYYVDVQALNQIVGQEVTGFSQTVSQSGNIIYRSDFLALPQLTIKDEAWVFRSESDIADYYDGRQPSAFYDLRHIFSKTSILESLKNTEATYYQSSEGILQVVTDSGEVGYVIDRDDFKTSVSTAREMDSNPVTSHVYSAPIFMAWEAVYSYNPNPENLPEMTGVNVVSPTWYELADASGDIDAKVSEDYLAWAEANNKKVWALVSNAFDIDRTHAFLHDAEARKTFINYMVAQAIRYGYDGINVDFENVYLADRDALTHFMNEFAWYTSRNNITLSMDVTVMGGSDNWSKCYDHEALGKIVDFLVVMTYDEHWASSPISGPVASFGWVQSHMAEIADVVSSEKLIMGLPAYTRVWRERPSETQADVMVTSSSAVGLDAQQALIEKYELTPIWDETDRLYYATFFETDALVKMWIENAETLAVRTELVKDLDLKGVAVWTRALASDDIWGAIHNALQ